MHHARRTKPKPSNGHTGATLPALKKIQTGIAGFDQITQGGIPAGRTTLVCGGPGCGKTLFGMHFLVRGAIDHGEPGAFVAFEETEEELAENVASLGFDVHDLERRKLLSIDHIHLDPNDIEENGEYDLEGLFLRIGLALDAVGAKRLVVDTLETVFGGLKNEGIIRSELRRLFHWLKDRGVTTIVTAERGEGSLTRHGLEEYVSDCVVLLDHRVHDQISTRRLRIVKYRGSTHGANEYPFLIDRDGIAVVPITGADLAHDARTERVRTGIPTLDDMLGGGGYYVGSTVLVSGTAGSGKSSISAHFANATCEAGKRALYVAYEESPRQIVRNMATIGLPLDRHLKSGLLTILAHRPTSVGLEAHLALLHRAVLQTKPDVVIVDPVGTMTAAGELNDAHLMLVRLIDFLKARGITTLLTSLTRGGSALDVTETAISSLVDTWILVKAIETNGERTRGIYVLKSRGMAHSNQIREFLITPHGIVLEPPYVGAEGVLTGTARAIQEARDVTAERERDALRVRATRTLERKRALLEQRIAELRAEFAADEAELLAKMAEAEKVEGDARTIRARMVRMRTGARRTGSHDGERKRTEAQER